MPGVLVVEVPQWQGSSSPDARLLADGSAALAGLLPDLVRVRVPVAQDSGASVLAAIRDEVRAVLQDVSHGRTITLGGDCGVEFAPIEDSLRERGDGLAVVWFDAHGDLNSPASSPSGAFHGMVLRALLGDGPEYAQLPAGLSLSPGRVVLAGVRALDPGEQEFVEREGIRRLSVEELEDPAALVEAVGATGARSVYVHVDLDVLDPVKFASVGFPESGGLSPAALVRAVRELSAWFPVVGLGITEYQPGRDSDVAVLQKLVPELVSVVL
jgi:arginase